MKKIVTTIGERFKDARICYNQHGKQSLKEVEINCEVDDSYLNKIENDSSVEFKKSIDTTRKLAEYYGVSADYLVGLSDSITIETDVKKAEKTTGLSHEAMKTLLELKKSHYHDILDALLSDRTVMLRIVRSIDNVKRKSDKALREDIFSADDITKLDTIGTEFRHIQRDASEDIAEAIIQITRYGAVNEAIKKRKVALQKQEDNLHE